LNPTSGSLATTSTKYGFSVKMNETDENNPRYPVFEQDIEPKDRVADGQSWYQDYFLCEPT